MKDIMQDNTELPQDASLNFKLSYVNNLEGLVGYRKLETAIFL